MMNLREQIEKYEPFNEQEENDRKVMLQYIENFDNVLTRENEFGHFTASAWALNKETALVRFSALLSIALLGPLLLK